METNLFLSFIIGLSCEITQQNHTYGFVGVALTSINPLYNIQGYSAIIPGIEYGYYLNSWFLPITMTIPIYSMSHNSMSILLIVMAIVDIYIYIYIYIYISLFLLIGILIIP